MIYLSKLSEEALLCVYYRETSGTEIMTVKDFLESDYFNEFPERAFPKVKTVEQSMLKFDFGEFIEMLRKKNCLSRDWKMDIIHTATIYEDEIRRFALKINELLRLYPALVPTEEVVVDLVPAKRVALIE